MIIDIDDIPVEIVKKSVKRINLRIYPPDGRVKVSAPLKCSDKLLLQYLQEKSTWIRAHRDRILSRPHALPQALQTGATIPFLGNDYFLTIVEHHGPAQIKIIDSIMYCYSKPGASDEQRQAILTRWYKKAMEALLPDLITQWERIIPVQAAQWGVKQMKTRWGSCNTRAKRIWLNLNLIKKPQACLEYVLVHELVHLLEASHNQRFYALMTQYMPSWRTHQLTLEGSHVD